MDLFHNSDLQGAVVLDNTTPIKVRGEKTHLQSGDVNEENVQTSENFEEAPSLIPIKEYVVKVEEVHNEISGSGCNTEPEQKIEDVKQGEPSSTVNNTILNRHKIVPAGQK